MPEDDPPTIRIEHARCATAECQSQQSDYSVALSITTQIPDPYVTNAGSLHQTSTTSIGTPSSFASGEGNGSITPSHERKRNYDCHHSEYAALPTPDDTGSVYGEYQISKRARTSTDAGEDIAEAEILFDSDVEYLDSCSILEPGPQDTNQYEACFGMLRIEGLQFKTTGGCENIAKVNLKIRDGIATVHDINTDAFIAIVQQAPARTMTQISQQYDVDMIASLAVPAGHKSMSTTAALHIIIYGRLRDSETLGDLLADNDMYLQHPQQFDKTVAYANPHYLAIPGQERMFPDLSDLSLAEDSKRPQDSLGELATSRIHQILDSASGPDNFKAPSISASILKDLLPYQKSALAMMFEKENASMVSVDFPGLWQIRRTPNRTIYFDVVSEEVRFRKPKICQGGIIADDMGMGKTFTALTFIASSRDATQAKQGGEVLGVLEGTPRSPNQTLIVAPKSVIPVWEQEIEKSFTPGSLRALTYADSQKSRLISHKNTYDIVLTTYETVSSEFSSRKHHRSLFATKWLRVILDEAHFIRDCTSQRFKAVNNLQTRYKWCLTGTPIQNKVEDYGALLSFLNAYPYDSREHFRTRITEPVLRNEELGYTRLERLVRCTALRRIKSKHLDDYALPERNEEIISVQLRADEMKIYEFHRAKARAMEFEKQKLGNKKRSIGSILPTISSLRMICNDSRSMLLPAMENGRHDPRSSQATGLDRESRCAKCRGALDTQGAICQLAHELACSHIICGRCFLVSQSGNDVEGETECGACQKENYSNFRGLSTDSGPMPQLTAISGLELSSKTSALFNALEAQKSDDKRYEADDRRSWREELTLKSVIFSCWTRMLNIIETALNAKGYRCRRIDGKASLEQRRDALKTFSTQPDCTVMLASIQCAGFGLNLTAANQVYLMEPQWNPMAEEQALARVHRIGQLRSVRTTRFIVSNSIEEYVQKVQKDKLHLIDRALADNRPTQQEIDEQRNELLQRYLQSESNI